MLQGFQLTPRGLPACYGAAPCRATNAADPNRRRSKGAAGAPGASRKRKGAAARAADDMPGPYDPEEDSDEEVGGGRWVVCFVGDSGLW